MAYDFKARLQTAGVRFKAINRVIATVSRGVTVITGVVLSPIHRQAEEFIPGVAITRVEFQSFAVDTADLGALFPPHLGDTFVLADGSEFRATSMDQESPVFQYVTGSRTRIMIHTDMIKRAS